MSNETRRCQWCGDIAQGPCGCPAEIEIERLQSELERRFGIGGELLIARRERDELRDKVTVKNSGLRHAISTLERDGDEWAVCESLRAAYKA